MKVFIETYGCTFNQTDSQIMAGFLNDNNIEITNFIHDADVIIINTCYVKLPTENKIVYRIQKLIKEFPEKKIIVSGCMVEIDPEKLDKIGPNCSWIGPHQLNKTVDIVRRTYNNEIIRKYGFSKDTKVCLNKIPDNPYIHIIQICEGCLGACTYCCTRFARGSLYSYPIKEIKKEAQLAIENGACEIQLTAQDTAAFGKDSGEKLSDLIKEVANLNGNFRIRVGMMHPKNILTNLDEIANVFKIPNVYKFIHLPVQSGSNKILNEMKRGHTISEYMRIINKFKKEIPDITIATDIIVAYPSENDEDFKLTCDLLKDVKPGIIHISKYQHRKGATSSKLKEIPHNIMKERSKYLTNIKKEITQDENNKLLGTVQKALVVEKGSKGGFIAKSDSYIPIIVDDANLGEFVNLEIYETTWTYLKGRKVNDIIN